MISTMWLCANFKASTTIASLTSSISMLEVPVSYAIEYHGICRKRAAIGIGTIVTVISLIIILNFDPLFDQVVSVTTELSQPLLGLAFCIFAAWIWRRDEVLKEIRKGSPNAENGIFWRIWPFYVKFICPIAILIVYFQ